jgi:predicted nucleic acid-binding Zn ribbon protein
MACYRDDDEEAELDAREWPDEADQDEDDAPAEVECPYCRMPVSEDADLCPHCRSFISLEDAPRRARAPWIWLAVVGGLLGVLVWMMCV